MACRSVRCPECLSRCAVCEDVYCAECLKSVGPSERDCCARCLVSCPACGAEVPKDEFHEEHDLCSTCLENRDENTTEPLENHDEGRDSPAPLGAI